jgi:hypothetical protein
MTTTNESIPMSKALTGRRVTTISTRGGIGIGYNVDYKTWIPGGNGHAYRADAADIADIYDDDGRGYRQALKGLALPPAYMC